MREKLGARASGCSVDVGRGQRGLGTGVGGLRGQSVVHAQGVRVNAGQVAGGGVGVGRRSGVAISGCGRVCSGVSVGCSRVCSGVSVGRRSGVAISGCGRVCSGVSVG